MVLNRQRRVRVSVQDLEKFLVRARRMLSLPADALTVCLVTDAEIARWNRAYRGNNRPTDVLSFPANGSIRRGKGGRMRVRRGLDLSSDSGSYLGDIAIAPAVARRNARTFGRTLIGEMHILILHGILHLMGYDHEADGGEMDRREQRLRRTLGLA
jgi:probable rRNA maturation factor